MPSELVARKVTGQLDDLCRRFIAASTLVFAATRRPDGVLDVTPRGDPGGFVHVLDDHTLAFPDRPGNFLMDTFENVIRDGQIGLIFVIPGHRDTLRVSGEARLVRDARLGAQLAVNGKPSQYVILIRVKRVLCHCPKAFIRGQVWSPDDWPDTSDVPTLAEMAKAHTGLATPLSEIEDRIAEDERDNLY